MELEVGARGDEASRPREHADLRGGQGLAVDLAVGGQRQGGEEDEGGRDHVLGQRSLEEGPQLGGGETRLLLGHDIGDQPPVVGRSVGSR